MLGQTYRPRVIDRPLKHALHAAGAVVIEGARGVGKTMTALSAAESFVFLDDPDAQELAAIAPKSLLAGDQPRVLDEWQLAPDLWNMVRRAVDASRKPGLFILTGSAVPSDDAVRHTGAGRFLRIHQRTMSWWEKLGDAPGTVSLARLFDGQVPDTDASNIPDFDQVVTSLLRPGFPAMIDLDEGGASARLSAYIDDISRTDVQRLAAIRHEPEVIRQVIVALARSVSSEVTYKTLAADVRPVAPGIDDRTVASYVQILERLFVVELQRAWTPALRSRAAARTGPRRHLVDPALAAVALGANRSRLNRDVKTTGVLFETAVIHDLMVLSAPLGGQVRHYRDSYGNELDAVVMLPDGRWGAFEVKLGGRQLVTGLESLTKAVSQIDTDLVGEPCFRMVITGTGPTLVTDDGTVTAPLIALAP